MELKAQVSTDSNSCRLAFKGDSVYNIEVQYLQYSHVYICISMRALSVKVHCPSVCCTDPWHANSAKSKTK